MNIRKVVLTLSTVCILSFACAALVFHSANLFAGDASTNIQVDESRKADLAGITSIEISEQISTDINVTATPADSLNAHFYGTISSNADVKKPELKVERNGNTLLISVEQDRDWRKKLMFNVRFNTDLKLDITIPQSYKGMVGIQTVSGDVQCNGFEGKGISVQTASGDIQIMSCRGESLECSTASGDLTFKESTLDRVQGNTASGDVNLEDMRSERVRIRTASGDIRTDAVESGELEARSASGEVQGENLVVKILRLSSTSGDVQISGMTSDEIRVQSTSGDIRLSKASGDVTASSTSGDIKAEIQQFSKNLSGSTTSGDIRFTIHDKNPFSFNGSTHGDITFTGPDGKTTNAERKLIVNCDNCNRSVKISSTSGDIEVN